MNILKIDKSKEAVADFSGSKYLNKSGIYDVVINFASIDTSKSGASSVNFNVTYNGESNTIYGPYITDKEGNPLKVGLSLVRDKLGIIAGVEDELTIENEEHVVGKDKKPQEFAVITEFSNLPVKIRLQEEYSKYNGEIKQSMTIKNFFREDGASAEEILNGTEIGKRLAYEQETLSNKVTYAPSAKGANDAPTPEEVAAWKESKKSAKATQTPAPKVAAAAPKLFGKK